MLTEAFRLTARMASAYVLARVEEIRNNSAIIAEMRAHISKLQSNDFLRNNLIFFFGSLFVSFLNYLYYPVLGRLLSVESFGELQVLISFYTQTTIFISVLTLISTNIIVNEKNDTVVNKTIHELEKITLYVSYAILAVVIIISPFLQSALKFNSFIPFIIITLVLVVGVSSGFRVAYLRGKNDYFATSLQGIVVSIFKIIASALLVIIGLKTAGAAGGILVSQIIGLAYATTKARKLGFIKQKRAGRPDWKLLRPHAKFALLVLIVSLICTMQYSVDVTVVKYLFSPEIAGQYAAIATISRIVLFLTGSFAVVLLTSVKLTQTPQQNYRLLLRSLIITLVMGGCATLAFVLFPQLVTHTLFGTKYDGFTHILPLLSVAMLMMSLCNLIANYHIALRHFLVVVFTFIGALSGAVSIAFHHGSPDEVVQSLTAGSAVMLTLLLLWTGYRALPVVKLKG